MTVDEYQKRKETLILALRTVATMDLNDISFVVCELIRENKDLTEQVKRLKEGMAENEANFMDIIKRRDAELESLKSQKKLLDDQARAYKNIKCRLGGKDCV